VVGNAVARVRGVVLTVVLTAAVVAGCSWHEKICRSGEYPAKAVGNASGRTCVAQGQNPPSGYVRYPAGQEPKYVGDKWDKYWSTKVVDENGNIVAQ
jgi:hypothetical protein